MSLFRAWASRDVLGGILELELAGIYMYWAGFWSLSWRRYTGRDSWAGAGGDVLGGILGLELAIIYWAGFWSLSWQGYTWREEGGGERRRKEKEK